MVTIEQARNVEKQLRDQLAPQWEPRGPYSNIAVQHDTREDYMIHVNTVAPLGEQDIVLPERIEGVRVIVRRAEPISGRPQILNKKR